MQQNCTVLGAREVSVFILCFLIQLNPAELNVVWKHGEELMIGRYGVGKLFILARRKLKSRVKD